MSEVTELIIQENSELLNYNVQQNIICDNKFLHYLSGYKKQTKPACTYYENLSIPYMYCPYTETCPIQERHSQMKTFSCGDIWIPESKIQNSIAFDDTDNSKNDPYGEDETEEKYLMSNPVSFLILSKPNVGETELAQILANHWKCLLITPETVLTEEIEAKTRVGQCIKFNLQNGRAIGPEVILRLVERRVRSETAAHRGFVIAGFPLIPNNIYKEDPLSSESAIFSVEEIFEEMTSSLFDRPESPSSFKGSVASLDEEKSVTEEEVIKSVSKHGENVKKKKLTFEEKIPPVDLGPELKPIIQNSDYFYLLTNIENQIEFLFNLFKPPNILIYISCSNLDVANKAESYRFNLFSEKEVTMLKDYTGTIFSPDIASKTHTDVDEEVDGFKNMVHLPIHLPNSVSAQLVQYKYHVQPIIDKKVFEHNPQHFIKVDGRLSASKMFSSLRSRLKCLGFQPVLIPEKLTKPLEIEGEYGEESQETAIYNKSLEETFQEYQTINVVNRMYKWQLSNWGFKCPVAFKNGIVTKGSNENIVRFMNKLFFLSDDDALFSFCRNPRPYLLPIKPKPVYRIFIMGPKQSGKTTVAKCLSYLFNCTLLDPNVLEEEYKQRKKQDYLETVKTAAIGEGLIVLEEVRKKEKHDKINFWLKNTIALLKTKFPEFKYLSRSHVHIGDSIETQGSIHSDVSEQSVVSVISERTYSEMICDLEKLNLPLDDEDKIKLLLEDTNKLLQYLPADLNTPIKTPSVFDTFVTQYVEDVVNNTIVEDTPLNKEELVDMYRTAISNVTSMDTHKTGGWIIDGVPPDMDLLNEFTSTELANEIICLNDEDPEHTFLLAQFSKHGKEQFTNFRSFFNHQKRYSAANRVPYNIMSVISISLEKGTILSNFTEDDETNSVDIQEYTEHLAEFDTKWEDANKFLSAICCDPPIEINITDKKMPALLSECILKIESKYKQAASIFTEEDKINEAKDFGANVDNEGEEEEEMGEEEDVPNEAFLENRRYGNTHEYCPVAFNDHFVLWKGKDHFSAQFEGKLYFLSNQKALDSFIYNPHAYVYNKPVEIMPPPRICLVGPLGSGKTTLAKKLARSFGLFYIDFEKEVLDIFDMDVSKNFDDISQLYKEQVVKGEVPKKEIEIIYKYLYEEEVLPHYILKNILHPLWRNNPYRHTGFVLDNFPRKAEDISYMVENVLIPDAVIELHVTQEQIHNRIFHIKLDHWQKDLVKKKQQKDIENAEIMKKWESEFNQRVEFMVETIIEERKEEFLRSQPPVPPYSSPVESYSALPSVPEEEEEEEEIRMFIYDPVQKLEDYEDVKMKVAEELPPPEFVDVWESVEEASERIDAFIDEVYARDIENLNNIKESLQLENIECALFNTNKYIDKVFLIISKYLEKFKFRKKSLFERVYSVTIDVAEKLLEQGYYFLSKFGRNCPVEIYEKVNPIQMFLVSEHKMLLSPMIHRRYIYFICGSNHRDKFKEDPLMYVQNEDYELPLFPLKMAIIGPPKCGKSYLAEKIQKELGLKVITRGQAVRYVLKNLSFCELAKNIETILEQGWSLTNEMIANAVEALTLDGKSIAQGYVLDGFPQTSDEVTHLRNVGVMPYVVIDLAVELENIKECTINETGKRNLRPFSFEFISYRYNNWNNQSIKVKQFLYTEYQNIYQVSEFQSKWSVWAQTKNIIFAHLFHILNYYKNKDNHVVFSLTSHLITPEEFEEKESCFKNYCPCCLYYHNHLVCGGSPPDRTGLVQYRDYYYWICKEHMENFCTHPAKYLPPKIDTYLPDNPPYVSEFSYEHYYQDGFCIVTFWDKQPKHVLKHGDNKYTVFYEGSAYIFCSEDCMNKFLKEPHKYYDKVIHFRDDFPLKLTENMPTLGYVEQYVSNLVIQAIINTEYLRPIHPYMDIATSAAMNIALYLKINNPKAKKDFIPMYEEFKKKFDDRREIVNNFLQTFKRTNNPFIDVAELQIT